MRRLFCLLVGISACGPSPLPGLQLQQSSSAIINGTLSLDDKQVFALGGSGGMFCTSTLIGARTLLTAAHCLAGMSEPISASNQGDVKGWPGDAIPVVETRVHPRYSGGDPDFDVGLVLLQTAPTVEPAAWNRAPLTLSMVPQVRAVGFGETHVDGSGVRYQAMMWVNAVSATVIYLGGGGDGGTSTCFGDSGGPSLLMGTDGVERIVGVHSFAKSAACNGGGDLRVDAVADFIDQWTRDKAPTCAVDGACAQGCPSPDLDCECLTDGQCKAECPLPDTDQDCPKNCLGDGVCAFGACGTADPDCKTDGDACSSSEMCAGHQCLEGQCTRVCRADTECRGDMHCVFGLCSIPVLPLATMGQPCEIGRTACSGGICAGQSDDTAVCRYSCDGAGACPGSMQCVGGARGVRYCQGTAVLTPLETSLPGAPHRCAVTGPEALTALATLFLLRRRTRKKKSHL